MLGPCALCKRELWGGGWGWAPSATRPTVWACSKQCLTLAVKLFGKDEIMTRNEEEARTAAGQAAGGYLDEIGKTDLGALTDEEWASFLDRLFETYHDRLVEAAHWHAPF